MPLRTGAHRRDRQTNPTAEGPQGPTGPEARAQRFMRLAKYAAIGVLGLQAIAILIISTLQYSRFDLGIDFTTSNQAAFLISHGQLNPFLTTHLYPYLDDHFGLLLYPIALLYLIYPHGILLLWLQDLASVGAELAVIWWVTEIVGRRMALAAAGSSGLATEPQSPGNKTIVSDFAGPAIVLGALVLMVADPWFYTACLFDFHLNAFAALFLLLAARDAWNGRMVRAGIFSAALLLTGDTGGLYLFGIGLSVALCATGKRRYGWIAMAAGLAWVVIVHVLAVNQSHVLVASYTYIVTGSPLVPGTITLVTVAKAIVKHPHRWIHVLWGRRKILYEVLIPTGVVGLASPWAFGLDIMAFYLQAIAGPLTFLVNGFDELAGLLLVLACSAMVIVGLAFSARRIARIVALVLGAGLLAQSLLLATAKLPEVFPYFIQVTPAEAGSLNRALAATPPGAEVIASWGVMGRFSERQSDYPLYKGVVFYPVRSHIVVFVLTNAGLEDDPPQTVAAIAKYARVTLGASVLVNSNGVTALLWHPPRGTAGIPIPSPSS
jgi:uncharacterized membrane protein